MHVDKQEKIFLLVLFLVSFLVRALVFHCYLAKDEHYWQVDSNTYHQVAQRIAQGKGITNVDGSPHFYRVPGYPLFLALYYKIFDVDTKNALWMQICIASIIPVLIFFLAMTLFHWPLLAKVAALYSAVHLGLVLYSGFFMTESLFILFFLLFLIFFFSAFTSKRNKRIDEQRALPFFYFFPLDDDGMGPDYLKIHDAVWEDEIKKLIHLEQRNSKPKYLWLLCAGIFLGFASLIRPVGHYLIVVACLLLLFSSDRFREKIAQCFVLGFAWLLPVSFWLIRNYLLVGHLFFHTLPGGHFLYLSAARVAMHVHHVSYQDARMILRKEVNGLIEQQKPRSEIERCLIHERLALKYFVMKPLYASKYWLTDMMRTCLSLYSAELLYLESGRKEIDYFAKGRSLWSMFKRYLIPQTENTFLKIVVYVEIIMFLFMLLGFVLGIIVIAVRPDGGALATHGGVFTKCLPFMALFIIIALAGGYARMRLPIEPFIIILSWNFWLRLGTVWCK